MTQNLGYVFWIFGLSGAGKSVLASSLIAEMRKKNIPVLALDGDNLRKGLCADLEYTELDRTENIRRAAEVARLAAESGVCVVASFITPLESQRRLIKELIGRDRLSIIYANAPLEVCRRRDPKGLYARAEAGQIHQMTGVDSAFEVPSDLELDLPTAAIPAPASTRLLHDFAWAQLGLTKQKRAADLLVCI